MYIPVWFVDGEGMIYREARILIVVETTVGMFIAMNTVSIENRTTA